MYTVLIIRRRAPQLRSLISLFAVLIMGCGSSPLPPPPTTESPPTSVPIPPNSTATNNRQKLQQPNTDKQTQVSPASHQPLMELKQKAAPATPRPADINQDATVGRKVNGPDAAGPFVMSICRDLAGNVWFGSEDQGVLRMTPQGEWTQFTQQDGLGDNNGYAICCDRLGRIWVGQLNHGVAVFNGATWRIYDVLDGPLGERVFDIECDPLDGDIWLATNLGLARYSNESGWSYFTREEGLPSDQVSSLAFDSEGNLYVGMECHGVAIARRSDAYKKWQTTAGEITDAKYRQLQGAGLPSPLVNDVLVSREGTVYVATSLGLAKSRNRGQSWEFIRGRDVVDKVRGRFEAPPKTWAAPSKEKLAALLPEDFITSLAEDNSGCIWLSFRQQGFAVIDPQSGASFHGTKDTVGLKDSFISATLPVGDGRAIVCGYGSGITILSKPIPLTPNGPTHTVAAPPSKGKLPDHPRLASSPTIDELTALEKSIIRGPSLPQPGGEFLGDDWKTQGDWVGRLGRQYTVLCATNAPLNDSLIADFRYRVRGGVGPNGGAFGPQKEKRELLRHWIHRRRWDDQRVLYNPVLGYRRQADWDDHGEAYPMTHEGPDLWVALEVPEGSHRVSLYFFNKDGHEGHNRYRDYLIELKGEAPDPARGERLPTLAKARVRQFWGGVYKQFAVRGPGKYSIKIACNDSFNTILQAVMLDQLAGPPGHRQDMPLPCLGNVRYDPPKEPAIGNYQPLLLAAIKLRASLDSTMRANAGLSSHHRPMLFAYRAARTANAPPDLLANWRWKLCLWQPEDRSEFAEAMSLGWKQHLAVNPQLLKVNDPDRPK